MSGMQLIVSPFLFRDDRSMKRMKNDFLPEAKIKPMVDLAVWPGNLQLWARKTMEMRKGEIVEPELEQWQINEDVRRKMQLKKESKSCGNRLPMWKWPPSDNHTKLMGSMDYIDMVEKAFEDLKTHHSLPFTRDRFGVKRTHEEFERVNS